MNEHENEDDLFLVQSSGEPVSHRDGENLESAPPTLRSPGFDFRAQPSVDVGCRR